MNERELDLALDSLGELHVRRVAPVALRERVAAVPGAAEPKQPWLGWIPAGRFQSLFSATKFVVAGVIVALFGGLLLSGALVPPADDGSPGALSTESAEPRASEVATLATEPASDVDVVSATEPLLGSFAPSGSLAEPREGFTSTVLEDGRVLVVGGENVTVDSGPYRVAAAEIWDPDSGEFTSAGSLTQGLVGHTATLLPDGRVLVVGGRDGGRRLADAEVWDPATTSFEPVSPMNHRRDGHSATLLPDGRVLVIGGRADIALPAEVWDPTTSSFSEAGSFPDIGGNHSVTLLPDGRVLVIDDGRGSRNLGSVQVWDPATATFESAGSMQVPRHSGWAATLLPDGRVLVVGGVHRDRGAVRSAEVWDPTTASFSAAGVLLEGRSGDVSAFPLPDGRVLVIGGFNGGGRIVTAETWDPTTSTFSPAGALDVRRGSAGRFARAWQLPDGRVLIASSGGLDMMPRTSTVQIWDPTTEAFSLAASSEELRGGPAVATLLPDRSVLMIGGWDEGTLPVGSTELWTPADA